MLDPASSDRSMWDKYEFDNLPEDFKLTTNNGRVYPRTSIECEISFYDEKNEHKKIIDVLNEIDDKCKLLKEWADNLPYTEKED